MSFKNLDLQIGYNSDEIDILEMFYKPILQESVLYQRLAGYFSSTTFGLVVREIIDFIERGGRIKLVTGIEITEKDKEVFEEYVNGKTEWLEQHLLEKIDDTVEFLNDCSALMGWMLMNKINGEAQLEIKIAVPVTYEGIANTSSLYHQKIGIFADATNNRISFEGSVNETGRAWYSNIESFKVSASWGDESDRKRTELDQQIFEKFWHNKTQRTRVIDLPTAVKEKFLKVRPQSIQEFNNLISKIKLSLHNKDQIALRDYQIAAIKNWSDNRYNGILEMATGTGKTFTAMGCINCLTELEPRLAVIIACPYTHIVEQWVGAFNKYNRGVAKQLRNENFVAEVCYAGYSKWKKSINRRIRDFNEAGIDGKHFIEKLAIFTTHNTLTSHDFVEFIKEISGPVLLIADEVHALGADSRFDNLLTCKYRLGLTATPDRYFDDEGTRNLKNYFGGITTTFPINQAIEENILSPYRYIPHIVDLNNNERSEYIQLTKKLAKKMAMIANKKDKDKELNHFVEGERASIIAAADKKYSVFEDILDQIDTLSQCLIYCHEKQLERVRHILFKKSIVYHQITYRESTEKRNNILKQLALEEYDAVVAVRCLDEGVDVPSAKIGIILASTGNPRQYIQRRGRLLRKMKGKTEAIIHDILVVPYVHAPAKEILPLEKKIVERELIRYSNFAKFAKNKDEADHLILSIREVYGL